MKKTFFLLSFTFCINLIANNKNYQANKIHFTENKGQISNQNSEARPDVLYYGNDGAMNFHIRNNGISYQLNRVDRWIEKEKIRGFGPIEKFPDLVTTYRIDINWKNSNKASNIFTDEKLPGYTNYYLAVCPDGITNVNSYSGVTYKNIYEGIDIHYYDKNGLKCDYVVSPNADYKKIQLEIKGAEIIYDTDGGIILKTPLGNIKEAAPIVFQNGKQLLSKWIITNNILSFEVENYNPEFKMIIDPLTRVWGTYYGGTGGSGGNDQGMASLADANGNSYLYGHTESTNSIATTGAHQTTKGGGSLDVFLVKFDSNGQRLWGTYIGGSGDEVGSNAVIDNNDNIYISGETNSISAIGTAGTQQPNSAGQTDAFIAKFNSSGIRQWGTYYGGNGPDSGKNLAIAPDGSFIVIAGETGSTTGFIGGGAGGQAYGGGAWDAFVAKFTTAGVRAWGTYYGGSVADVGYACSADISGNVYLTGLTESDQNIASSNAYQATRNGGRDAFFVKFNTNGTRQWGTYYGGSSIEVGTATTTDAAGNIYFCGWTTSGSNIATTGTYQPNYSNGLNEDSFVVKFKTNGTRVWGTYVGGMSSDQINGCYSKADHIYIVGKTYSVSSIATNDGYQTIKDSLADGFLIKIDTTGNRIWGSYYGGNSTESIFSCYVDNADNIYLGGISYSSTGIASPGSYQNTLKGTTDAFLIKMKYVSTVGLNTINNNTDINIYPNPSTGNYTLQLDNITDNIILNVYNTLGQIIETKNYSNSQTINFSIDTESGVYFVELITNRENKGKTKVIKQ